MSNRFLMIPLMILLCLEKAQADGNFGIPVHGFADALWGYSTKGNVPREKLNGFSLGTFDLYLVPQFSDRVTSLIEIAFEPSMDEGDVGLDVERLQMGYIFNDKLTLWFGRFHSPYGYWNNAYHHGAQIQTSIAKPRFIDWEDHSGFMPAHSVGIWARGQSRIKGGSKWTYDFYITNGNHVKDTTLDMNIVRDDNTNPALGFNLGYGFGGAFSGLLIGIHGMSQKVNTQEEDKDNNIDALNSDLKFGGGYLVYEAHNFEISSEYYHFDNSNLNKDSKTKHKSSAWFMHVGYFLHEDVISYVRYEDSKLDKDDRYFSSQKNGNSYNRSVLGLRYNLNYKAALKIEGTKTKIKESTSFVNKNNFNEIRIQYAISF